MAKKKREKKITITDEDAVWTEYDFNRKCFDRKCFKTLHCDHKEHSEECVGCLYYRKKKG